MGINTLKEELEKLYDKINECNCPEVAVALLKKAGILEHKTKAQGKKNNEASGVVCIGQRNDNIFKG